MIFVETAVLSNIQSEINVSHNKIVDYLLVYHPNGFYAECDIYVNQRMVEVENFDKRLYEDDIIILVHRQGFFTAIAGSAVLAFVANMAISMAVSYVLGKMFPPEIPSSDFGSNKVGNGGRASSVYSLNSQQNEAKIGEIIPIIYGRVRTYPALVSPPYRRFENNEEYLYQLMCVGQGRFDINKMMIADTDVIGISKDSFRYEVLVYEDFRTVGGIEAKVNDDNYRQLVKTIPDVDNLEIRGTPQNKSMTMRFEGSEITFFPYLDGSEPDLSSLSEDSKITISETPNAENDGVYYVLSVVDNVVTVKNHTFVTAPSEVIEPVDVGQDSEGDTVFVEITAVNPNGGALSYMENGDYFKADGLIYMKLYSEVYEYSQTQPIFYTRLYSKPTAPASLVNKNIIRHATTAKAEFETSYGDFVVKSNTSLANTVEIDFVFPTGIYNTNDNGDFTLRKISISLCIIHGSNIDSFTEEFSALDNSAIRISKKYNINYPADEVKIRFKRITPEPSDIRSMDKMYIRSIKSLYPPIDNEELSDITLIWAKIRASNAISSVGQFAINAFVTRKDVERTVKDVITDIYTNETYGGRLDANDLELMDTPNALVNGAFDTKLTVMDAMQLSAKSSRYNILPVGDKLQLKHDGVKPLRSALFNETNIIKDSLKITYNFSEAVENDSVKITYRSADDFKSAEALYPEDGIFPEIIELWGCTDESVAFSMAKYLYKQGRSRRKIVEFQTDLQGLIPQFYDRVGISHNFPSWGVASEVRFVLGDKVVLADEIDEGYDSIMFRDDFGGVSEILGLSGSGSDVVVADVPPWVHGFDVSEPTKCSIGNANSFVQDFLITSIKPAGQKVKIQAVNYDENVFE